jgi:eukaryotic-like serine/threonine-protein kinase
MTEQRLGRYVVQEVIGAGGMGVVYRARDEHLERDVALKVLPPGKIPDSHARLRFRKEALALSRLNHPAIATIYDFLTEGNQDFLVMEFVPGETLDERLARGFLTENEAVLLALQIVDGMVSAHERGVVHRDLKPANVRVMADDRVKILDFGLAQLSEPIPNPEAKTQSVTQTGAGAGTLAYMAPEQLLGETIDARTDIYCFGGMLYEMVTRHRPFEDALSTRLVHSILYRLPAPPRKVCGQISPEIEVIVLKCLEKDPAKRYQSAADLRLDLRRLAGLDTGKIRLSKPRWYVRPVAILMALVIAVLAGFEVRRLLHSSTATLNRPHSETVAVLPLENLSGDPAQEYFAEGMTEELINSLSRISALRVIARTSVMRYQGTNKTVAQIANELHADRVLEGSIRRAGDRIRVSAQLIDPSTERSLWADEYDRDIRDVLALQSDVARSIAQEIKVNLTPREQALLAKNRSVDPEVFQLYLQGRYYWNKRTEEGLLKALDYFQKALQKDPTFALGYAGRAECYVILGSYYRLPSEVYPLVLAEAKRALELDEAIPEAHTAMASYHYEYQWDWAAGEKEYRRALDLNPSYATAHQWYAESLVRQHRFPEAIAEIQRARELDPLSLVIGAVNGEMFFYDGKYDEAKAKFREALEVEPTFYLNYLFLGWTLEASGHNADAISQFQKSLTLPGGATLEVISSLGHAYAMAGEKEKVFEMLRKLQLQQATSYVDPYNFAILFAGLGDKDATFKWLEKGFAQHSQGITYLAVDPRLNPLRSDPRFLDLAKRMNLPL